MAAPNTPREPHRSFTVRIPDSLYNQIGDLANAEGLHLNAKVNQLLRLGLGEHVKLEDAMARLLRREVTKND